MTEEYARGFDDIPEPEPKGKQPGGKTKAKPKGVNGASPASGRGTLYGRLTVLTTDDLDTAKQRGYIIKGLMSPGEISLWTGPPKCGKSFLMLHLSYLVSLNRSVLGRRVRKARVLYVAAEGEAGIANRIKALRDRYGDAVDFYYIAQPADLLHEHGHLGDLLEAAEAIKPDLIVVDTLSRAMAGGDENSPVDMGIFVANASKVTHETGAHVAIVHHGTQSTGGAKPRGHGSLMGGIDALIEVLKQEDGTRTVALIAAKDDADGMRWGFDLEVVDLGIDDDGDKIMTLIVIERDEAPLLNARAAKPAKLPPSAVIALQTLRAAINDKPALLTSGLDGLEVRAVHVEEWRSRHYREVPAKTASARQKAFKRAMEELQAADRIKSLDGFAWVVGDA
jgi:AAA domain